MLAKHMSQVLFEKTALLLLTAVAICYTQTVKYSTQCRGLMNSKAFSISLKRVGKWWH